MNLDLTFKDVCELIKKHGKQDSALIDAVDQLLGFAMICSPILVGPAVAEFLPTLAMKNELVKIGKGVFEKLTKKKDDDDYVARQERMQMAYGLLCFTAFFETLDRQIPQTLRDKIKLLKSEKILLAESASGVQAAPLKRITDLCDSTNKSNALLSIPLAFPHPTESLDQQLARHATLWRQMAQGIQEFIQKLAFWETAEEKEQGQILSAIKKAPEGAASCFEAQYFELARKYSEFAIWSNLQEHKKTKESIRSLSKQLQHYSALSGDAVNTIDIGFSKLHDTVLSIPETLKISQATELVESLGKHYQARITDPIIVEDGDDTEDGQPKLSFPRIREAFIPQSFRVLRQTGKSRRLEDDETWKDLTRRNDLGAFIFSYLSSPFSTEAPLLILGHPGSGKSLLTTVLSAQLMSKHFTAIRVPLREVNAEAGIVAQIEEAIRRITNIGVDSWAMLSKAFKNNPPLVILDGYDELLQASGKVFSGYLKDVQNFQKSEAEQGRPVRAIVTSRVTLIDKATVPTGATVLRLLEFSKQQQERWISIWNMANVNYFRQTAIQEFALPDEKDAGAEKILSLAQQPLLLLMLALYDSQGNQLGKSKGLDRTKLYDSLLRRFVERERAKEKCFIDAEAIDRKKILDTEMHRLGVAALGMYNRRKVHILSNELNDDLKFFQSERHIAVGSGAALSQADLLLGSFFFVHKSKAQHAGGVEEHHKETSAFEFLHNTFGEFLTADFILRRTLIEVVQLKGLAENSDLREQLEKRLGSADGFERQWFASLVYTPLFTRPVVLEMIREWVSHILKDRNLARETFISYLDTIVINQIKRLLEKREMPSMIHKETAQEGFRAPFDDHPLLGHIAIYSTNLILLRVIVGGPFVFDEEKIGIYEDGTRPWDRLTHIWRSWFSLDNLNAAAAIFVAERNGARITIRAKKTLQVVVGQDRLRTILNVGLSLGDNITSGLAGLLLFQPDKPNDLNLDDIATQLNSEKIALGFEIAMKRLFDTEHRVVKEGRNYINAAHEAFQLALQNDQYAQLEHIALSCRRAIRQLRQNIASRYCSERPFDILRQVIDPRMAGDVAIRNPEAGLVLWHLSKEIGNREWSYRFGREFLDSVFHRHSMEIIERFPEAALACVRLVREMGGEYWFERFGRAGLRPEFMDRMFDPRYLMELCERSPEAGLAWVKLAREMGDERWLERFGRAGLQPEFMDRIFDPHYLIELSERSPEAALAWVQLASEMGGEHWSEQFGRAGLPPEFMDRLFDPHYLMELSEHSPEAALAWVQMAREMGREHWSEQFGRAGLHPEFVDRMFNPRYLMELSERSPEAALAWVQLAREMGGKHWSEQFGRAGLYPGFVDRMFDPRYLMELSERSPEAALAWVQLAREMEGEHWFERLGLKKHHLKFMDRLFDPHYLMELSERSPEVALIWVQLVCETGGKDWFNEARTSLAELERIFGSPRMSNLLSRNPSVFRVMLRLAKGHESPKQNKLLAALSLSIRRVGQIESVFENLPLSALSDVKWFAESTPDRPAMKLIQNWLHRNGLN